MNQTGLDVLDIRILDTVQKFGLISKTRLAEQVNLTATPCWARLKRLQSAGIIRGQHADIALEEICDFTMVVVTVSLSHHRKSDFERFEKRVAAIEEITECFATGGGMDYLLKVVSSNLASFQSLMESLLEENLGIERYITYIATRTIKSTHPNIPLLMKMAP